MAFNDRLKEARLKEGMTQEQVADKVGIAKSTLTGYEKGNREPNMLTIQKLMETLSVDANYLWQDEMNDSSEMVVSAHEWDTIYKYRKLDKFGKLLIDKNIEHEYERVKEQSILVEEERRYESEYALETPITYPKTEYLTGLSAGNGLYVFDDIPTQVIQVPDNYKDADFVIGVSGNSMIPTFKDGDKVAVKKAQEINIGDIGVFMIDGNGYIKEFGKSKLISHNKEYDDIGINSNTTCIGKVLGKI